MWCVATKLTTTPVATMDGIWSTPEESMASSMQACATIGSIATARQKYQAFKAEIGFDELMAVSYIFDERLQYKSY